MAMIPEKWLQSGRSAGVDDAECDLCGESHACFEFTDTLGYGHESLCLRCLRAAVDLLEERLRAKSADEFEAYWKNFCDDNPGDPAISDSKRIFESVWNAARDI